MKENKTAASDNVRNGTLTLMVGIPGSGKSTVARSLSEATGAAVCSTDDFWYLDDPEVYAFDATRLGEAHAWNKSKVEAHMKAGRDVIVDNTNLDERATSPYYMLSYAYSYDVTRIVVDVPLEVCVARQESRPADRRVPADVLDRMYRKLVSL